MKRSKRKKMRMNMIHFKVLLTRYFRQILTNIPALVSLLAQAPVMLLIVAVVYVKDCFVDPGMGTSANTMVFILTFMAALMGILNSYREICKEREILGREVYGGLDVTSYVASKLAALTVVGAIQCAILVFGSMTFIDFNMSEPVSGTVFYLLAMILTNVSVASVGLLISALLKKSESAILPVLLVIILQVVFSDRVMDLTGGAAGYLNYVTPVYWGSAALGKVLDMNSLLQMFYFKDSYDYHALVALIPLVAIVFVCYTGTVLKLKHDYKTKE